MTGDSHDAALAVARKIEIESREIHARQLPWDKQDRVSEVTRAFFGGVINKEPVFAAETVDVCVRAVALVAAESADVLVVRTDMKAVAIISFRRVRLNFMWVMGYIIWVLQSLLESFI